jgi:uncharacterized protein YyaL (SSP411 family)
MTITWQQYEKLLEDKVRDAEENVEYYEKKTKEARVIRDIAVRGLESFRNALDKKLGGIGE